MSVSAFESSSVWLESDTEIDASAICSITVNSHSPEHRPSVKCTQMTVENQTENTKSNIDVKKFTVCELIVSIGRLKNIRERFHIQLSTIFALCVVCFWIRRAPSKRYCVSPTSIHIFIEPQHRLEQRKNGVRRIATATPCPDERCAEQKK